MSDERRFSLDDFFEKNNAFDNLNSDPESDQDGSGLVYSVEDTAAKPIIDPVPVTSVNKTYVDVISQSLTDATLQEVRVSPPAIPAAITAQLSQPPGAPGDKKSGPVFEAAMESFRRSGMPIRPNDDAYILMEFMHGAMQSMHDAERAAWRVTIDDTLSDLHNFREEMSDVIQLQKAEIQNLREEIRHAHESSVLAIGQTMRQAEESAERYAQQMTSAAESKFQGSLRELINTEIRVAIGKSASTEIELLRKALIDATAQAKLVSSTIENSGSSSWQKNLGLAVLVLFTLYLVKSFF